jgi:hypothetical protein
MKRLVIVLVLICPVVLWAQTDTTEYKINLEEFAERLFQLQDEDVDYEDIYESLLMFFTDPLNLNRATGAQLASLYILSPVQINNFLEYREKAGKLLSIYELQAIPGFDLGIIEMLLPFVTVAESRKDSRPLMQRILTEKNNYLLLRYSNILEPQAGYNPEYTNPYAGSPDKIYGRFRVSHRDDFSLGFTFEKDHGEAVQFKDGQNGFDFYSAHFMLDNQGPFRRIIVGDFQLQVGQGLIYGAGFNPGKGAETVNTIKRNTIGLRPYTSVLESGFFRGAGVAIPIGNFEVSAFYSYFLQDASVRSDTTFTDFDEYVSSIQFTGLHRTASELAARKTITENSFGGYVTYQPLRRLQLGAAALNTHYSIPILRTPNTYNQFEFSGQQNTVVSTFGSYLWQNFNFFGEVARSSSGGVGAVGGMIASLTSTIDLAMSLRSYDRDFHSFYANGFGEGSRNINEKGIYWGIRYRPSSKYMLAAYYDKFSFPWLRFRAEAPTEGYEWLGRFTYKPTRNIVTFIQMREEQKEENYIPDGSNLVTVEPRVKRNYIFNIDYSFNRNLSMKTRVQTSTFDAVDRFTTGYAIIQDVNASFGKFVLSTRMALFETEDFDNRQYVFERDVLFAFSIPAYNGVGMRTYAMLQYKMNRNINWWVRWARFSYTDRNTVGSSGERIDGPLRTEVKVMARVRF